MQMRVFVGRMIEFRNLPYISKTLQSNPEVLIITAADDSLKQFFYYFSEKIGLDIAHESSACLEDDSPEIYILFFLKNNKN